MGWSLAWHEKNCRQPCDIPALWTFVLNVPTQLLAGCLSNSGGGWPFSSSLQTTWPLRCFWLRIIHWWCPSHESLRLCIQTLTRLTAQKQTHRTAERAGWMEMSTSGSLWQVGWCCDHTLPHQAAHLLISIFIRLCYVWLTAEYTLTKTLHVIWMRNSKGSGWRSIL